MRFLPKLFAPKAQALPDSALVLLYRQAHKPGAAGNAEAALQECRQGVANSVQLPNTGLGCLLLASGALAAFVAGAFLALGLLAIRDWEVSLTAGKTPPAGTCRIQVANATGAVSTIGWRLGAQRWFPRDKRGSKATYVSVQDMGAFPVADAQWELIPQQASGAYHIKLQDIGPSTDGVEQEIGWYLTAEANLSRGREAAAQFAPAFIEDASSSTTTSAAVEWELQGAESGPGTYKIVLRLPSRGAAPPGSEQLDGWSLVVLEGNAMTKRNQDSTYVTVSRSDATVWELKCSGCCSLPEGTPQFYS